MISHLTKPMEDWTFRDLVQWNQGQILLSIPQGKFNEAVFAAMDIALRWKEMQKDKKP